MLLDKDIEAALAAAAPAVAPERDDTLGLRAHIKLMLKAHFADLTLSPDVDAADFAVVADDGTTVSMRWYHRGHRDPGAAIVYVHGGGRIGGSVEQYEPLLRHYVQLTRVPVLAVAYRLAPEWRHTVAAEDAFAAIRWLSHHAKEMGVDPARIALMGDSGGGGVAAGAAIIARDNGM